MICSNTYQYNILTKATDLKEREARNIPHFSFFSKYSFIASFTISLNDIFFSIARNFIRV
jgi:hypothetical protein